jgi:DNA-binding PadR family transcriptional regulator
MEVAMAQTDLPGLSRKEFIIMNLLVAAAHKEMYGLELVDKSQGELKRGTIYVTLGRLQEKGYINSRREDEKPGVATPRRLYKPTGLGAKVFHALASAGGRAWLREVFA